jgi:hypothetical protein
MKRMLCTILAFVVLPVGASDRYPPEVLALSAYCAQVGRAAELVAGYHDDGFDERVVLAIINQHAAKARDPDFIAEVKDNTTMIYHDTATSMSEPWQIGQGVYRRCMGAHQVGTPQVAGR